MKKAMMVVLAILIALGVFLMEGGNVWALVQISAAIPLLLGPLVSAAFTFSWKEISAAFADAFASHPDENRQLAYQTGLLVARNLHRSCLLWAATIFILALIGVLSGIQEVSKLGPTVALAMVALLMGFGLNTFLFSPMIYSLEKKILLIEVKIHSFSEYHMEKVEQTI